jgi:ERF superfamily
MTSSPTPEPNSTGGTPMGTPELNKALAAVQATIPHVAKSEKADAGSYSFDYADLTAVTAAILPLLGKHGLAFTAMPSTDNDGRLVLDYALTHESGQERAAQFPLWMLIPERVKAQQIGGYITFFRRYCLCAATGVAPGGEDNDAADIEVTTVSRTRTPIPGPDHERLRHPEPAERVNGKTAERFRSPPPDDPWRDQPAGELPTSPLAPEERPGTIDGRQRSAIMARLTKLPRDERLARLSDITGRTIESANDLSWAEADRVVKALQDEAATAAQVTP